ncbi:MAG: phosphatase PAP2 family protein [Planctomycetaceae bacterium]
MDRPALWLDLTTVSSSGKTSPMVGIRCGETELMEGMKPGERPRRFSDSQLLVWFPLMLLVLTSVSCRLCDLDLRVSGTFWSATTQSWPGKSLNVCLMLHRYGGVPGVGLIVAAFGVALFSKQRFAESLFRRGAVCVILCAAIGQWAVVNEGFKNHWGRPRPIQTTNFGGALPFAPLGVPGNGPRNSSFPSGHAAIAFFTMTPGVLLWQRSRQAALLILAGGAVYGFVVGASRILMGAHYISDVIWSAGLTHFIAVLMGWRMGFLVFTESLSG